MQRTFISAYGKVIIENDVLYVRHLKPVLTLSRFLWYAWRISVIARFILYLLEEESPRRNTGLVLFSILSLVFGIELIWQSYKAVFLKSFSNRIALRDITSFRLEEDANELETHLFLHLRSGKERKLTFRKLEKEYEALAEQLSQYIASPKFA